MLQFYRGDDVWGLRDLEEALSIRLTFCYKEKSPNGDLLRTELIFYNRPFFSAEHEEQLLSHVSELINVVDASKNTCSPDFALGHIAHYLLIKLGALADHEYGVSQSGRVPVHHWVAHLVKTPYPERDRLH